MVRFQDRFERADGTLGNGWTTLGNGVLEVNTTIALPSVDDYAVAVQDTTTPTTREQAVKASVVIVTGATPSADAWVTVGIQGSGETAGGWGWGYGIRLTYGPSTTRTLELIRHSAVGIPGSVAVLATTTVTFATNATGLQTNSIQEIQLVATRCTGGLRLRGYFNNQDAATPDLEEVATRDVAPNLTDPTDDFGKWYMATGLGGSANVLGISEFEAENWGEDAVDGLISEDQFTRSEVRATVLRRYAGGNSNLDTTMIDEMINDTVDEMLQLIGDDATFMYPSATVTLTRDSNGFARLPTYMRNVRGIYNLGQNREAIWQLMGYDSKSALEVQFSRHEPGTGDYRVEYEIDWDRTDADTDRLPIPRRYAEVVNHGVLMRIAGDRDSKGSRASWYGDRFYNGIQRMKKDLKRQVRQHKRVFRAGRRQGKVPGQLIPYDTGY